jgi:hypothetical protein
MRKLAATSTFKTQWEAPRQRLSWHVFPLLPLSRTPRFVAALQTAGRMLA